MSTTEPKERVQFTPRDSDRAELRSMASLFNARENDLAREAFEAGLPIVKARKIAAGKQLSRAAGGRK